MVATFLRESGWPVGAGSLLDTAVWLQSQVIETAEDFIGLGDIAELAGAVVPTAKARCFLQSLVQTSYYHLLFLVARVFNFCFLVDCRMKR